MTEKQSSAPVRATAGVIHVRRRLTANFTILSNKLAQRPGSAVTVGIGVYLMSVREGTVVSIDALRAHFDEGETRISGALRELEAEGYLERVTVRTDNGRIRTRTYVHNDPHGEGEVAGETEAPAPPPRAEPVPRPGVEPVPQLGVEPVPRPGAEPAPWAGAERKAEAEVEPGAESAAAALLGGLRERDGRLLLSWREVARLAPAVQEWLRLGAQAKQIADVLTTDLPTGILRSPAGLIAYRLAHSKPAPLPPQRGRAIVPMQNCEGCDRGFRAPAPGLFRECHTGATAGNGVAA